MTDADQNKSETENAEPQPAPTPAEAAKPANPTALYAALVIGVGILAGVAIAAISLHQTKVPAPVAAVFTPVSQDLRDLGTAEDQGTGLQGHMTSQWTDHPTYSVTIQPADPALIPGFALAVLNPPRPLSINLLLKDRLGFVICSHEVLLSFPVSRPADLQPTGPKQPTSTQARPRKLSARAMERMQAEQADFDRRQAEEAAREKGKDLFQNQLDASGKVVSITAKGDVSCPADSYDRVATWSFVPDFPTLDEQDEMVSLQPDSKQAAQRAAAQRARRRMAYKPPSNGFTFAFEGDDAVVDYDAAAGEMQTRAGKTFMIDKKGNESDVAIWQEYPAYFHYRCEQATSSCTLNRAGSAVLHATLKR